MIGSASVLSEDKIKGRKRRNELSVALWKEKNEGELVKEEKVAVHLCLDETKGSGGKDVGRNRVSV